MLTIKIVRTLLKNESKNCKIISIKKDSNINADKSSLIPCQTSLKSSNPVKSLYMKLLENSSPIDSIFISVVSMFTNGKNKITIDNNDNILISKYFRIISFI